MDLQTIIKAQRKTETLLAKTERDYRDTKAKLEAEIAECERLRANVANGLDLKKIAMAETLIYTRGETTPRSYVQAGKRYGETERVDAIEDAMTDIASGVTKLRREYIGVKNYAHFGDQRCDCTYGFGPRHGSIVFEIGLHNKFRMELEKGRESKDGEIDACLYYLEALKRGALVREAVS